MKNPWEWDESDIESLITNQVPESISLDYKACGALGPNDSRKNEISKDVSAFANSAGGTIVYGLIEKGHLPERIDDGYDPSVITREWLEQVINSRIQRRIDGIRINQVLLSGPRAGRVLYVVHIPQSVRAPHQASDKKFYRRVNFGAEPMEEYEIRDVSRRSEAPDLELEIEIDGKSFTGIRFDEDKNLSHPVDLNAYIWNESPEPAYYAVIGIFVDSRVSIIDPGDMEKPFDFEANINGQRVRMQCLNRKLGIPNSMPIWMGTRFRLMNHSVKIAMPRQDGAYHLGWQVSSPRMLLKSRFINFEIDPTLQMAILRGPPNQ